MEASEISAPQPPESSEFASRANFFPSQLCKFRSVPACFCLLRRGRVPGRAVTYEADMGHDTIDIERCIWDMDYRRVVKRLLNFRSEAPSGTANQNHRRRAVRAEAHNPGSDLHSPS